MVFSDLDYCQDKSGVIFIVRGNVHPKDRVMACPVYWPDPKGDRINTSGIRFRKEVKEVWEGNDYPWEKNLAVPKNIFLIPRNDIVCLWKPKTSIERFLKEFRGSVWTNIFQAMVDAGVPEDNIGIFGSYLVGLHQKTDQTLSKDIDFLIYGEKYCQKIKNKFKSVLSQTKLTGISKQHVSYESKKLGGCFNKKTNNFRLSLENKWSSIQVAPGVLTTIRFVRLPGEEPNNLLLENPVVGSKHITGVVIDDFGINFIPRHFKLFDGKKIWNVLTYFWVFHQAVKNGEVVTISGNLHAKNDLISLDSYDHGIKILKKGGNEISSHKFRHLHQA